MEPNIGDYVVTIKRLVYRTAAASWELPKGVVGEIVGINRHLYMTIFDYPRFRDRYIYVRLEKEVLPIEQDETPEVDVSALESILQGM